MTRREREESLSDRKKYRSLSREIAVQRQKAIATGDFESMPIPQHGVSPKSVTAQIDGKDMKITVYDAVFGFYSERFVSKTEADDWVSDKRKEFISDNSNRFQWKRIRAKLFAEFQRLHQIAEELKKIADGSDSAGHTVQVYADVLAAMTHVSVARENISRTGEIRIDGDSLRHHLEKDGQACLQRLSYELTR